MPKSLTPIFEDLIYQYADDLTSEANIKRAWMPPQDEWALRAYWRGFGYFIYLKGRSCG